MPDGIEGIDGAIGQLMRARPDLWERGVCGLTQTGQGIPALVHRDAHASGTPLARVLMVGGLSGRVEDAAIAQQALEQVYEDRDKLAAKTAISAVPCLNIGVLLGESAPRTFPRISRRLKVIISTPKRPKPATSGVGPRSRPRTWCWKSGGAKRCGGKAITP